MGKIFPIQAISVAAATLMAVIVSTGLLFAGPSPAMAQTLAEFNPVFVTKSELQSALATIEKQLTIINNAIQDLQARVTVLEHRGG